MPANLTPDYLHAEEEYRKASTPEERLSALKKMWATLPKHKGTEKLQADIKRRMAMLREEIQQQSKKKGFGIRVERMGAGQVVLVGPPNSGKSQLLASLCHVHAEIAPYPFTTREPHPAMMPYEDIQIQLVDLPPVSLQHMETWVPNIIRTSDLVLLVVDLSSPRVLEELEETIDLLEKYKIKLVSYKPREHFWESIIEKRTHCVGTKQDIPGTAENSTILRELYSSRFGFSIVSAITGYGMEKLKQEIFDALEIVRVYSKPPGEEPDLSRPYTLPKGSTLLDFAGAVHRDFVERLKFARLWGHGKFEGQRIQRDYVLQDKDIIELHI